MLPPNPVTLTGSSPIALPPPFNVLPGGGGTSGNGGLIADAVEAIIKGVVDHLVSAVVKPIGQILATAIKYGLQAIGNILVALTKLQIGHSYWAIYGRVVSIAVVVGIIVIFCAVIDGALRGSPKKIVMTVARVCVGLMASFFLAAVLPLVQGFFAWAASTITGGVGGVNAAGLAAKLTTITVIGFSQIELIPLMIAIGIFILLGILLTLVVLIVSIALVYFALALFPIMVMLSPVAMRKTLEQLGVCLATPALITLVLCLGVAIFADGPTSLSGAVSSTVIGAGLFILAALAPFILLKLIPHMEEHFKALHNAHGQTAGKVGGAAASLATGQSFASRVAGGEMGNAAGAAGAAAGGGVGGLAGFVAGRVPRRGAADPPPQRPGTETPPPAPDPPPPSQPPPPRKPAA